MAGTAKRKLLALDSNVPLDLADGKDFAHAFREEFQARGYALMVPPTVVTELMLKAASGTDAKAKLALCALQSLRAWGIQPYDLKSVGHGITGEFARRLIHRRLLPDDEFNDGVILAETALASIPVLVTGDHHLLDIEATALHVCLREADLNLVSVAHPRRLLKALH